MNPLEIQIARLITNDGIPVKDKIFLKPKQVYKAVLLLKAQLEQRYPALLNLTEEPEPLPTAEDLSRVIQLNENP